MATRPGPKPVIEIKPFHEAKEVKRPPAGELPIQQDALALHGNW